MERERHANNLYHISLHLGFDVTRTEKSTVIRFSVHLIEVDFPSSRDRLPEEEMPRRVNREDREDGAKISEKICFHIECARFEKQLSPRAIVLTFRLI